MADRELSLGTVFTGKMDLTFRTAINKMNTALRGLAQAQANISRQVATTAKGMTLYGEFPAYSKYVGGLTDRLKDNQVWATKAANAAGFLGNKYGKSEVEVKRWGGALDKAITTSEAGRQMLISQGKSTTQYTRNVGLAAMAQKTLAKESKATTAAVGWQGKQIGKVTGGFARMAAAMKVTAAYGIAAAAIFTVTRGLKNAVGAMFEFDQALKNLQAITSATDAEIAVMGKTILDIAVRTKFSAKEVADAMVLLGQAGFSASEAMQASNAVAMLATGTLSNMAVTADILTTAIRSFALDASEADRIADNFANAINRSKLTIDKLRIAMAYVGPVAHKAGVSLQETVTAMMLLANSGLRASTIGTGLRQIIARLVAPSRQLREEFTKSKVNLDKLNPATNDFADVVGELSKIVTTGGDAVRLFGLRASAAVSALTLLGKEGFERMYAYTIRAGAAAEMAEKQMEGLSVMAKNLKDKLQALAISIGKGGLADAFGLFLMIFREVVDLVIVFVEHWSGRFITSVTILTGVLLALRLSLKFVFYELGSLIVGMAAADLRAKGFAATLLLLKTRLIGVVMWLKTHPYVLLAGIIAGLIVGVHQLVRAQRQHLVELQKTALESNKVVESLTKYKEELAEVNKGSSQHHRLLQDLIKDFPELSKAMLDNIDDISKQGTALENLYKARVKVAVIDAKLALIGLINEMKKLKRLATPFSPEEIATMREGARGQPGAVAATEIIINKRNNMVLKDRLDLDGKIAQKELNP